MYTYIHIYMYTHTQVYIPAKTFLWQLEAHNLSLAKERQLPVCGLSIEVCVRNLRVRWSLNCSDMSWEKMK